MTSLVPSVKRHIDARGPGYTRGEMTDHSTPVESVHSATASAHISHAVIATYAAAAAVEVAGVRGHLGRHSTPPERRIDPERAPKGVRVVGRRRAASNWSCTWSPSGAPASPRSPTT